MEYRVVRVRMVIEATINLEQPVERSGETQLADFVLPALQDLKDNNPEVKTVVWQFTEEYLDEPNG